ncbi:MAG TPA: PDZ domain-containing protein [Blastocatellia bacterium]|nr:PDZ domain-containing protein [Blastocatellia bacterium]
MISRVISSSFLVALACVSASAQMTYKTNVERSSIPWAVSVVHTIDLQKALAQVRQNGKIRFGLPPSAPAVLYNVATGVLVDDKGHVVTRLGFLDGPAGEQKITVAASDGTSLMAKLVGVDLATGFAVLEVASLKGSAPKVAPPDSVAKANVRILSTDVSEKPATPSGSAKLYLSAFFKQSQGRVIEDSPYSKSCGALTLLSDSFRSKGDSSLITTFDNELIGMAQYAGFGRAYVFPFAFIRDTVARRVIENNADVPAGWLGILGVSAATLSVEQASQIGIKPTRGVVVSEIVPDSPAAKSGMRTNDLVLAVNDANVTGAPDLARMLSSYSAGAKVSLRVLRESKPLELQCVLGARHLSDQEKFAQAFPGPELTVNSEIEEIKRRLEELGAVYRQYLKTPASPETTEALREIQFEIHFLNDSLRALLPPGSETTAPRPAAAQTPPVDLTQDPESRVHLSLGFWARELKPGFASTVFGIPGGMLVDAVGSNTPADRAGLKAGDVIVGLADKRLLKLAQLQAAVASTTTPVELRVVRNKEQISITIAP